jgi:hypothetical protein
VKKKNITKPMKHNYELNMVAAKAGQSDESGRHYEKILVCVCVGTYSTIACLTDCVYSNVLCLASNCSHLLLCV